MTLRRRIVAVVGFILAIAASLSNAELPTTLPADKSLDLFLLIGQSNMAGRGTPEPEDKTPHPRVWSLDKENQWIPAVDPLHFDKPQVAGVCLGLTFGKVLAEKNPDSYIGLIPSAVGGTSIDQWKKSGKLYEDAIARAKIAMTHGKLKGILWHQGESDSSAAKVPLYAAKLDKLIADLRTDLDAPEVPFIAGQIGEFHFAKVPGGEEFNNLLLELPNRVPHTGVAKSHGLTDRGDQTHFDSPSLREFGRRYAAIYLQLTTEPPQPTK